MKRAGGAADEESEEEALQRANKVADELLQHTDDDNRIGLVTHGDFMSYLIKALIGAHRGRHLLPLQYSHYVR